MNNLYLTFADFKKTKRSGKSFFLGPWFNENNIFLGKKSLDYHWLNLNKIEKDYRYLYRLKKKIFIYLTKKLNNYHSLNYSNQSWSIVIEPFLQMYLTVLFDRWEIISNLNNKKRYNVNFYKFNEKQNDFKDTEDLINRSFQDHWNHCLFQDIFLFKKFKNIRIKNSKRSLIGKKKFINDQTVNSFKEKLIELIVNFTCIFKKKFDFFFFDHSFSKQFFFKIHMINKSFPYFSNKIPKLKFNYSLSKKNIQLRENIFIDYQINKKDFFENFFVNKFKKDIPTFLIEDFKLINSQINKFDIKPKFIFSQNNHWYNQIFKTWLANKVSNGSKLIIMEHGGSFPYRYPYFNFEEDMCDYLIKWFKPMHKKHYQISGFQIYKNNLITEGNSEQEFLDRKNCTVIYDRFFNYTLTIPQPVTGSDYIAFNNLKDFERNLNEDIKKILKIKFHPADDKNMMSVKKIFSKYKEKEKNIANSFKKSRFIICFYPETTFSEAISLNIPTVLFFPKGVYKIDQKTKKLINSLKRSKIIFDNPKKMADHINMYWNNPCKWWHDRNTIKSINFFKKEALGISKQNTLENKWKNFFNKIKFENEYR